MFIFLIYSREGRSLAIVGIIANPASGKDIRRLVAHATVFDNLEKVNIVRRLLLGLQAVGVKEVLYMPDYFGIVPKALDGLVGSYKLQMSVQCLDISFKASQEDTIRAAALLEKSGAKCIITLGGDGTNRLTAKGSCKIPILPVSTGTNNVFPSMVEGTTAGIAAGLVALDKVGRSKTVFKHKKINVYVNGELVDMALVDAVVLKDIFVGSRAIWDEKKIMAAVVTRGETTNIGITSIAAGIKPIEPTAPHGAFLKLGQGSKEVMAVLSPGLIKKVRVSYHTLLNFGEKVVVDTLPCIIALDGEREIEVKKSDYVEMEIDQKGPLVIKIKDTMDEAAFANIFQNNVQ